METQDLLGFAEIEAATGIPQQTARRYAADFKAWLPSKTVGRAAKYAPVVLPTFAAIRAGFEAGLTTAQIRASLTAQNAPVIDVAEQTAPMPAQAPSDALAAIVPMLERLTVAVEALAASQAETVRLLRESRENPRELPVETPEPENDTQAQAGEKKPEKRGLWRRIFGGGGRGE